MPILFAGLRCERVDAAGAAVDFTCEITAENALRRINDELQSIRGIAMNRAVHKREDALWARGIDPAHVEWTERKKELAAVRAKEKAESFRAAREAQLLAREEARARSVQSPSVNPSVKAKLVANTRDAPAARPVSIIAAPQPKVAFTFTWPEFPTAVAAMPCASLE